MKTQDRYNYLLKKRNEILKAIKPKLNAWGINDERFDYKIIESKNGPHEVLIIDETRIGCDCNSVFAVEMEVLKYLIVEIFCRNCGFTFDSQLKNFCQRYWSEE